jgi:hypothetical protein
MCVRFFESWLGTVIFWNRSLHTALLWNQNHFVGKKSLDTAECFANDKEIFCFGTGMSYNKNKPRILHEVTNVWDMNCSKIIVEKLQLWLWAKTNFGNLSNGISWNQKHGIFSLFSKSQKYGCNNSPASQKIWRAKLANLINKAVMPVHMCAKRRWYWP